MAFFGLTFLSPTLLLGLLALPVLWWLLRATPPSPVHFRFPGVRLLLGLPDTEKMPERTPLWLLLIRMLAIAATIIAFAEPVMNPEERPQGDGPLLVLMDAGWASAGNWQDRIDQLEVVLDQAARSGRPTAFVVLAQTSGIDGEVIFRNAKEHLPILRALKPQAWAPDRAGFIDTLNNQTLGQFDTLWMSDGLAHDQPDLAAVLSEHGQLRVFGMPDIPLALLPLAIVDGNLGTSITSLPSNDDRQFTVNAYGVIPNGSQVVLATVNVEILAGETSVDVLFDMPVELRNRITKLVVEGAASAGLVALADESLQRRKVALVTNDGQEGPRLTRAAHYLRSALETSSELIEGELGSIMQSAPDVIILSDVAALSVNSTGKLIEWVENGGLLLRFAGPTLAASGLGQREEDPLLPVRLRAGGRQLGGAMSWESPRPLRDFTEDSPFFGLEVPEEVLVYSQVVAQPDLQLADRTLAMLEDGTPLVTRKFLGDGMVVLFHVTANAEWSNLPLSGLFVQMLERLSISSSGSLDVVDLAGQNWSAVKLLDGFGALVDARGLPPVSGERFGLPVGADAPSGMYTSGDRSVAINVMHMVESLQALQLPSGVKIEVLGQSKELILKQWFIIAALAVFMLDIIATLIVSGRFRNSGLLRAGAVLFAVAILPVPDASAQTDDKTALLAANNTVLAYVLTGDDRLDEISAAGLAGLGRVLFERTSIEPIAPIGVDISQDELAFFPLLYWPISQSQADLSDETVQRLNSYMAGGGMILFDTRDANIGNAAGGGTPNGRALQRLTAGLDIPSLALAGADHVLTRTFYLLPSFPGRWDSPRVWVKTYSQGAIVDEQYFASLNDGVTPVIIGANDWASGWAITDSGRYMFPVGRGSAGDEQREMSYRFGVNLVMYVMTGNYKSDQVHVPALLERLGE